MKEPYTKLPVSTIAQMQTIPIYASQLYQNSRIIEYPTASSTPSLYPVMVLLSFIFPESLYRLFWSISVYLPSLLAFWRKSQKIVVTCCQGWRSVWSWLVPVKWLLWKLKFFSTLLRAVLITTSMQAMDRQLTNIEQRQKYLYTSTCYSQAWANKKKHFKLFRCTII